MISTLKPAGSAARRVAAAFDRGFFMLMLGLFALVGVAGTVAVAVFGELGTEYPMPLPVVILRFAVMLLSVAAVTAIYIVCARFLAGERMKRLDSKRFTTALIALCVAGILAVQLTCAFCLEMKPVTDIAKLDNYAVRIVQDDSFACLDADFNNHYIIRYQNNLPMLLIMTAVYRLCGISHTPLIVLNTLCINLAILLTVLTSRRLFGERGAVLTLLLCAFFAPYYTYTPYFYTDSFSIPFVTATVFTLVTAFKSKNRAKKTALLLLSGALCVTGFAIKGSVIILAAAVVIYLPLRYGIKRAAKMGAAFLLSFCLLWAGGAFALKSANLISERSSDRYQFPALHWVMMGLNEQGAYTQEDGDYSAGFSTMEERKAGELEKIGERLHNYGFFGMLGHLGYKLVWTYMDGTYYIANYLENYVHRTPLHELILYDGAYRFAFFAYSFGYQLMLFLMMALSARKSYRKRVINETTLLRIAVVGMVLFFLIWETNARYPFNFTPLYLLLATASRCQMSSRAVCGAKFRVSEIVEGSPK